MQCLGREFFDEKGFIGFFISTGILLLMVLFGVFVPEKLESVTASIQVFITDAFGWYYLILVSAIVIVCLYFLISPLGKIRLGRQDDRLSLLP
ncbi:glycine betaine transporter OpuD [Mesobacillus boroniphilus JCM 21738]|uniref:Glycine betaine transporter OpuD n=1 Tax=Mesobacillus boroniphilus JCM 21738 TaxID=1294265 RepID=W4RUI8_9BACI|nr:glycine betaine transporter OpuD [Mesobacillus boroniphilus JCM 21738]